MGFCTFMHSNEIASSVNKTSTMVRDKVVMKFINAIGGA
jgi:hypothetical protein